MHGLFNGGVNCHDVAKALLGEPIQSDNGVLKYGALEVSRDTWIDHVSGRRGGLVDLIAFKTSWDEATAKGWLAREFPDKPRSKVHRSTPSKTIAAVVPSEHPVAKTIADDVDAHLGRFIVFPSISAHIAVTLWVLHAHLMREWEITPRLACLSAEPESGKSRVLEVPNSLVPNPVWAVNVTPAYLIRKIGEGNENDEPPTILYDEIDTVFGPKANNHEDTRALLNAGYQRGAVSGRCVIRGKTVETEEISAYAAVALAGIGNLPDTIMSRSVIIRMKRRAPNEQIEPYRQRVHSQEGKLLRQRIAQWAQKAIQGGVNWPLLPLGVDDRQADIWEPLLVVADAVGGKWPTLARDAAVTMVSRFRGRAESLGVRLLMDIRAVLDPVDKDGRPLPKKDSIGTKDLLEALYVLPEAPWKDLRGKPLTDRGLAKLLTEYDIKSGDIRIGEWHGKGYQRGDFLDAWARYVADAGTPSATTSATD
jgi:hypothetical protein